MLFLAEMPLLVSTGLGLLVREFCKRVKPNKQAAPALTRGLYTVNKKNVVRRKRVYNNDPFSNDELKQRLGGYCVRRYCSSTSINQSDLEWQPVYRFHKIPLYSGVARAKFLQTIFSALLVPYQTYGFLTDTLSLQGYIGSLGFAAIAPLVLVGFTRYFNRIIGVVSFNEENQLVRFGYLGFWGGRKNLIVSLDDIMPLTDTYDLDDAKAIVKLDLKQHGYLLLSLRDCQIVDEEIGREIFGNLKYFKKLWNFSTFLVRLILLFPLIEYLQQSAELMASRHHVSNEAEVANFDLFCKNRVEALNLLAKAISADENPLNTKRNVLLLYKKAIWQIRKALQIRTDKCPSNSRQQMEIDRQALEKNLSLAQERSDHLTQLLGMGTSQQTARATANGGGQIRKVQSTPATTSSRAVRPVRDRASLLKNVNGNYGDEILSAMISTSEIKMSDILGNEDAKLALEESVILPTLNPALFSGLREPCKGILLFGPPGNGKTMLAKAVATESECAFFNISSATIMSKWVGDAERMMQALFQVARNAQPSIIFIDEVDSLLSERKENENGAARRVKTEFLLQFDGCSSKSGDRILVLGATNRPQELDDAIMRRFPRRIYIALPDERARANLIKQNFSKTNTRVQISDRELNSIARACDNYSFSDLSALCREAAMFPLKGLSREQLKNVTHNDLRAVTYQDLFDATKLVRASSNPENVKKLKEYATSFA
ncbi:AAA domain-containing protein [Aphelenchoides bicaudatus]|nr:AAA domain-containing protein [Aphelenchoides bicaudatus]